MPVAHALAVSDAELSLHNGRCMTYISPYDVSDNPLTCTCREDALAFLTTCFPGNPLVSDILAGCDGDANAATAKLLELKDEEQAHALAQSMQEAQELSAAPAKVRHLSH